MKRTLISLSLLGAMVAGTAGTAAPAAAGSTRPVINIVAFRYRPSPLTVAPRTRIDVRNVDGIFAGEPHSLTGRGFNTGVFTTGIRTITAPSQEGTYRYLCIVHGPSMNGTLIVDATP
jgi:plastocyanin